MLHVSPTHVQFTGNNCEIQLENQSNCTYNIQVRANNTTAYKLQKIEFQLRSHEHDTLVIQRVIDRHMRQGDAFYIRYSDSERETRQHEICLFVIESKDSHFLRGERDKLYLDQSLSNLEDLERHLKDQKYKLEQLHSSYQLQKKDLQAEKKRLEVEYKMCQRQFRAVSAENMFVRLQNHLNVQNLTVLVLIYVITFLLVVKW